MTNKRKHFIVKVITVRDKNLDIVYTGLRCKYCNSTNVIRYGRFKTTQRWWCKDCQRKFADNGAKPNMKTHNDQVSTALGMYYEGMSLNTVCKQLELCYNIYPSDSTVYSWIGKYTIDVIKRTSPYRPAVGDIWLVDDTILHIHNRDIWLWDVMDIKTRYLLLSYITEKSPIDDAASVLALSAEKAGKLPHIVITGRNANYGAAIKQTYGQETKHLILNTSLKGRDELLNNFRDLLETRNRVLQGLKKEYNLDLINEGWVLHYNFFRFQEALHNRTPSEMAGMDNHLDKTWATTLKHVRKIINAWRQNYKLPAELSLCDENVD